ncbi:hypothetical protein BU16DRAFT_81358 [Lophium mytilinum]|uniref:Uncharacterized protein n=1 Tax=Lophium mytilinum TaxID=390894 RepID=A0A6A6QM70_9PEZI|nr:hypothetical protein BU16DRAFT_81358 [Lophium mytilinum]
MPYKRAESVVSDPAILDAPHCPPIMSDGNRDRSIWRPADGNGDPNRELFMRSFLNKWGHPTWKLFIGDVADEIEPTKNEPPRHVYLDDKAAYTILNHKAYTARERYQYWAFDFNRQGMIRTNRPNRGRPVYQDEHQLSFASAPQLNRPIKYIFSGGLSTTQVPVRTNSTHSQNAAQSRSSHEPTSYDLSGSFKHPEGRPGLSETPFNSKPEMAPLVAASENGADRPSFCAASTANTGGLAIPKAAPKAHNPASNTALWASTDSEQVQDSAAGTRVLSKSLNRSTLKRSLSQAKMTQATPDTIKKRQKRSAGSGSGSSNSIYCSRDGI